MRSSKKKLFYVRNMGLQSKDDFLWVLLTHSPIYMMALWKVNLSVFPALCSGFPNFVLKLLNHFESKALKYDNTPITSSSG